MDDFPEDLAVRVRNVGKTYRLGVISRRTLRDELVYRWLRLRGRDPKSKLGRIDGRKRVDTGLFHALDDVSFDIRKGETVGLIGRNGAGKSTMLKILARITTPTTGEAWIRGRVGSMLEVGTGFHPELTGRENIYLNGTILGMTKQEIDAKFDEIVEFSEIGAFLDTPVKRYSSGMYVKLAFSIASSLDNDVLLLDEVLAVGDAAFRKKSLARMKEIAASGRTILFVSHSMGDVKTICSRCIWFDRGRIVQNGPTDEVAPQYEKRALCDDVRAAVVRAPKKERPFSPVSSTTIPQTSYVAVDNITLAYDSRREAWNVQLSYSVESETDWVSPRAAVAVRNPDSGTDPLAVFDSAVMRCLPARCPSKGVLEVCLPPQISFSIERVSFDVRLWAAGILVFNGENVSTVAIPPDKRSPATWLRSPFRNSEFRFAHFWRLATTAPDVPLSHRTDRLGSGVVRVVGLRAEYEALRSCWKFFLSFRTAGGDTWELPRIALAIRSTGAGAAVVAVFDTNACDGIPSRLPEAGTACLELPDGCSFAPGVYTVDFRIWCGTEPADDVVDGVKFTVDAASASPGWKVHPSYKLGMVNLRHIWSFDSQKTFGR